MCVREGTILTHYTVPIVWEQYDGSMTRMDTYRLSEPAMYIHLQPHGFKPWCSQTNDFNIGTCRFLARYSALLGLSKDWLAQCQHNNNNNNTRFMQCSIQQAVLRRLI